MEQPHRKQAGNQPQTPRTKQEEPKDDSGTYTDIQQPGNQRISLNGLDIATHEERPWIMFRPDLFHRQRLRNLRT
jgi:hypothetical protein